MNLLKITFIWFFFHYIIDKLVGNNNISGYNFTGLMWDFVLKIPSFLQTTQVETDRSEIFAPLRCVVNCRKNSCNLLQQSFPLVRAYHSKQTNSIISFTSIFALTINTNLNLFFTPKDIWFKSKKNIYATEIWL